jgi:predicted O-methyltransferase YrrM
MSNEVWAEVDQYLGEKFLGPDPVLESALAAAAAAGLPSIQVSALQGKRRSLLARIQGAHRILEVGTLGAYSTIWLARSLPVDGRMISLEVNPAHAAVARANLVRAGLEGRVEVRVGPALETLPMLESEGAGPFDFVFLDADKVNNAPYFDWAVRLGRPGTVIVVHNVVRKGAVARANPNDASVEGTRRMFDQVAADPRVSVTTIQTVGSKGYDGFTLAVVR